MQLYPPPALPRSITAAAERRKDVLLKKKEKTHTFFGNIHGYNDPHHTDPRVHPGCQRESHCRWAKNEGKEDLGEDWEGQRKTQKEMTENKLVSVPFRSFHNHYS